MARKRLAVSRFRKNGLVLRGAPQADASGTAAAFEFWGALHYYELVIDAKAAIKKLRRWGEIEGRSDRRQIGAYLPVEQANIASTATRASHRKRSMLIERDALRLAVGSGRHAAARNARIESYKSPKRRITQVKMAIRGDQFEWLEGI